MSQNTTNSRMRPAGAAAPYDSSSAVLDMYPNGDVTRHQLYDPPVPVHRNDPVPRNDGSFSNKRPTIKFDDQDVVHKYKRPGTGDDTATHEHRQTRGLSLHDVYPPGRPNAPPMPKSPKRYPRGSADDDEEESETLFRNETLSSEGHGGDSSNNISTTPPDITGIRLVMINEREYF